MQRQPYTALKIRLCRIAAHPLDRTEINSPHLAPSSHQLILPEAVAKISAGPTPTALPCLLPALRLARASGKRQSKNVMAVIPITSTTPSSPRHPDHSRTPTRRSCGGRNPRNLNHAGTHPPLARLPRHHSVTPVPPFRHSREGGNPRPKPSHDAPLRTQPPTPVTGAGQHREIFINRKPRETKPVIATRITRPTITVHPERTHGHPQLPPNLPPFVHPERSGGSTQPPSDQARRLC